MSMFLAAVGAQETPKAATPEGLQVPATFAQGKVRIVDTRGRTVVSFKPKEGNAVKVYDAQDKELAKFTLQAEKLKAKSADDKALFELKHKAEKFTFKDPSDKELYKIKRKGNDFEFTTADDKRLYRLKVKGNSAVLEDAEGMKRMEVHVKDGKARLTDSKGIDQLVSSDLKTPLGLLFFGITELNQVQQAACLVVFTE